MTDRLSYEINIHYFSNEKGGVMTTLALNFHLAGPTVALLVCLPLAMTVFEFTALFVISSQSRLIDCFSVIIR